MKKALFLPLQLSFCTFGYLYASVSITQAQVTSDGTVNTVVTPNGNVAEITGGETKGSNLFHSFQEFSVSTGNEAFFNNAHDISNIFSRVTGGNISNIDGLIRANGSASLFLINPAGIIFGENASLNIGGSFYGSTASSILFEDGEFSAVDNLEQPVLTINAPIGLSFRDNPAEIAYRSNANDVGLEVSSGETIGLIGGKIDLKGGLITAPGGTIELGGLIQTGTISITEDGLSFPEDVAKADVRLSDNAVLEVTSDEGGLITVNANNLELTEESSFKAEVPENTAGDAGDIKITVNALEMNNNAQLSTRNEGQGNAGNVTLEIIDSVLISGRANINTQTSESGSGLGNAGNVSITANTLELRAGANIFANNRKSTSAGSGDSGSINIEAKESVSLINSNLRTSVVPGKSGDSGNISIKSPQVSLTDNATISASSSGGNIGQIEINAEDISIDNFALITASSRSPDFKGADTSTGSVTLNSKQVSLTNGGIIDVTTANEINGGEININAEVLEIFSGGVLQTATEGVGNGGKVDLNISDRIIIDGENTPSQPEELKIFERNGEKVVFFDDILNNLEGTTGVVANATKNEVGNGGNISIKSNTFKLDNNAQLLARNTGVGNGGNITLDIADSVVIDNGANINAEVSQGAIGNAGNIKITANTFELLGEKPFKLLNEESRTIILADNDGQGNSGNITIQAQESVFLSNSIISSTITDNAAGNSGNIQIESPQVSLTDNTIISVSTLGSGVGGKIQIDSDLISIDNFSLIAASSRTKDSTGSGDIILNSKLITLSNGGVINATTASDDNAGQITINAEILEIFSGGVLQTATEGNGNAGDIILDISDRIVLDGNNAPNRRTEFDFEDPILNNLEGNTGIFAGATETTSSTGGNIEINTKFIVAFPNGNSDILANSKEGQGGAITINAKSLFGIAEGAASDGNNSNDINASSGVSGLDGTVKINTSDTNAIQGARELPSNVVTPEQTIAQACQANREIAAKSGFTIKGKGGIPNEPGLPLDSQNVYVNGKTNDVYTIPKPIETSVGKIQPARGIKVTESGGIILTAYPTNNAGDMPNGIASQPIPEIQGNCG